MNIVVQSFREQQTQQSRQSKELLEQLTKRLQQGLGQLLESSLQEFFG